MKSFLILLSVVLWSAGCATQHHVTQNNFHGDVKVARSQFGDAAVDSTYSNREIAFNLPKGFIPIPGRRHDSDHDPSPNKPRHPSPQTSDEVQGPPVYKNKNV